MSLDQLFPWIFGAIFVAVLFNMGRGFFKHGGFKGMMFGAGIRRTVGEVEGSPQSIGKVLLKVHALDAVPEKAVGLEFVAKTFASYQMMPISLSAAEARKLIAHLQTAIDAR